MFIKLFYHRFDLILPPWLLRLCCSPVFPRLHFSLRFSNACIAFHPSQAAHRGEEMGCLMSVHNHCSLYSLLLTLFPFDMGCSPCCSNSYLLYHGTLHKLQGSTCFTVVSTWVRRESLLRCLEHLLFLLLLPCPWCPWDCFQMVFTTGPHPFYP